MPALVYKPNFQAFPFLLEGTGCILLSCAESRFCFKMAQNHNKSAKISVVGLVRNDMKCVRVVTTSADTGRYYAKYSGHG